MLRSSRQKLENDNTQLRLKLAETIDELKRLPDLERKLSAANTEISELKRTIEEVKQERMKLQNKHYELEDLRHDSQYSKLRETTLQDQLLELEAKLKAKEMIIEKYKLERSQLEDQTQQNHGEFEEILKNLKNRIQTVERDNKVYEIKIDERERELNYTRSLYDEMREKNKDYEDKLRRYAHYESMYEQSMIEKEKLLKHLRISEVERDRAGMSESDWRGGRVETEKVWSGRGESDSEKSTYRRSTGVEAHSKPERKGESISAVKDKLVGCLAELEKISKS